MNTTIVKAPYAGGFAGILPGDRIAVVNGVRLDRAVRVIGAFPNRLVLDPPYRSAVEWSLYADQHEVEVLVPEAARPFGPKRPPKRPVRVVEGVRLVSHGDGHWATEDGRHGIQREAGVTYCDEQHPMRFTTDLRRDVLARPHLYSAGAYNAARADRSGYLCDGGEHTYPVWTVWSDGTENDVAATMEAALEILASALRRQV